MDRQMSYVISSAPIVHKTPTTRQYHKDIC